MTDTLALAANEAPFGVGAALRWAVVRDLRLALRSRAELGVQLLFYVIVVSLFPLASSPDRTLLATMGPGVIWVAALLASLLSLPRLFASDFADGTLEQIALSPYPLPALVTGKILAHWLTTGVPIVVLAPLLGLQYGLDAPVLGIVTLSLLIGTPILSLVGAIGGALTLGVRGGGSLLALLTLPLYVPVLIFGAGAADAVRAGLSASPHLSLLGGRPVDRAGRRAARHRHRRADRARLMNFYQFSSPATFYPLAGRLAPWFAGAAAVLAIAGRLDRLRHRAHRLPAGRGVPDHLHPRARRVDVDVHLSGDGVLGHARAGVQHAIVGDDGAGARADRGADDVHRAVDRRVVGPADLGHVLGVGRTDDV